MAAIAGTLRWTRRFWSAIRKRLRLRVRAKVKPLTFAEQRKLKRDLYGADHTPCRCPACRKLRASSEDTKPV